jgi:energy-coupling factor transport system permease protein
MNKMIIGRYLPLNSPIHRLDPRTKIAAMVVLMIAIFLGNDTMSLIIAGVFVAAIIKLSGLGI